MPKPNESVPDNSPVTGTATVHAGIFRIPARSPQHADIIAVRGQAGHRHIAGPGQRDARPVIEQESVLRLVDPAADTVDDVALGEFDQVYEGWNPVG